MEIRPGGPENFGCFWQCFDRFPFEKRQENVSNECKKPKIFPPAAGQHETTIKDYLYRGIDIKNPPLRVQNRRSAQGVFNILSFRSQKKGWGVFNIQQNLGILAWVLLVNLSKILAWFLLVNLPKMPKIFRCAAEKRLGGFNISQNLWKKGWGVFNKGGGF